MNLEENNDVKGLKEEINVEVNVTEKQNNVQVLSFIFMGYKSQFNSQKAKTPAYFIYLVISIIPYFMAINHYENILHQILSIIVITIFVVAFFLIVFEDEVIEIHKSQISNNYNKITKCKKLFGKALPFTQKTYSLNNLKNFKVKREELTIKYMDGKKVVLYANDNDVLGFMDNIIEAFLEIKDDTNFSTKDLNIGICEYCGLVMNNCECICEDCNKMEKDCECICEDCNKMEKECECICEDCNQLENYCIC